MKEKSLAQGNIHIGTSGWYYDHWIGRFYPENIKKQTLFQYYQQYFNTVELNNTFYRLPKKESTQKWAEQAGDSFIFSIKASRYITHIKKLKDPDLSCQRFFQAIEPLGEYQGPILFQLPPGWSCNRQRLEKFLQNLPPNYQYVFEFRNESWWNNEIYQILEDYQATFCIFDLSSRQTPIITTNRIVYIRLHGPQNAYQGCYSQKDLEKWYDKIKLWREKKKEIFCYFDNDQNAFAAHNAWQLKAMTL